jgi:hypothetical protein
MKRSEVTRESLDEKSREIESQHVEEVGVAQLLVQTCPFTRKHDAQANDQCGDGSANVKPGCKLINHYVLLKVVRLYLDVNEITSLWGMVIQK